MTAAAKIVLAEDDEDDYLLAVHAFQEVGLQLHRVKDGEELMDFLRRRGGQDAAPPLLLVLLDLRMPKKSGWEALREIKNDALLRRIPVVVLTSSNGEEEIERAYDLGCNSFIRKPMAMDESVALARSIKDYWLRLVEIPRAGPAPGAGQA